MRLGSQSLRDRPVDGRICIHISERRLELDAVHRIEDLPLHLSFNLLLLITRVKDVHCLEIEGAHSSHKSLLKLLLHHGFGPVLAVHDGLCFAKLVSESFNLLAVLSADVLELKLDRLLKVFSVLHYLPLLIVLLPTKEYSALLILLVLP